MRQAVAGASSRRRMTGLVLGPALFFLMLLAPPLPGLSAEGQAVAALALLMAVWWVAETIPIPATALLPIILLPLLGVSSIGAATAPFAHPLIFLFLGGFIIALGMQRTRLHRRIALNIVRLVGTRPTAIIAGFMIASALLSMWVSNTATAMMMLPIALSIVSLVESKEAMRTGDFDTNFALVMLLCIAYACNIGGLGTLIGTPPNALLAAYMSANYGVEIGFAQWMLLGVPLVLVSLPLMFILLTRYVFPVRLKSLPGGATMIANALRESGRMSRGEIMVACVFVMTALLWVFRPLLETVLPGLSDSGIAVTGALLMFLLPLNLRRSEFVLNWDDCKGVPWGILLLFGGGLSLASAITSTGLAEWIGAAVGALHWLPMLVLMLLTLTVIIFLTEITSNTATAAAFLPILASVALAMDRDPLLLALPAAIGASCAFMLPVATPPNAIVFSSGLISIPQMARAGFVANILMIFVITLMMLVLMQWVFGVRF